MLYSYEPGLHLTLPTSVYCLPLQHFRGHNTPFKRYPHYSITMVETAITDPLSKSKTTIILSKSSDWDVWIGLVKSSALDAEIWDYCDPDLDPDAIETLEEPEYPTLATLRSQRNEAVLLKPSYSLPRQESVQEVEHQLARLSQSFRKMHQNLTKRLKYSRLKLHAINAASPNMIERKQHFTSLNSIFKPESLSTFSSTHLTAQMHTTCLSNYRTQ